MKKMLFMPLLVVLASCSSLMVTYDYDKQTDFTKYKTFAFSEDAQKLPIGDLNRDRVLQAVETEMKAKGFTKSDTPDVLVDLHVKAEEKMDATATTSGPGYGAGYYGRYGYGGGFSTTQINYNEYIEGTLFVNMVDKAVEKIVWQGRATKTIDEDASAQKREQNINSAVKQIFTRTLLRRENKQDYYKIQCGADFLVGSFVLKRVPTSTHPHAIGCKNEA